MKAVLGDSNSRHEL
jgi:cullin 3